MIFQSYALWPHMTAFQNVAYPLQGRRLKKREIAERVGRVFELVGIPELQRSYPGQMSGGQQQRVALARALVGGDELILFDEPLSNVDAKVREQLRFELLSMQRELGFAAIYVTHDQAEAMELAHPMAVMREGRSSRSGPPQAIYPEPASTVRRGLRRLLERAEGHGYARLRDGVAVVETEIGPSCRASPPRASRPGGEAVVICRPERTRLAQMEPVSPNRWHAEVRARAFLGANLEHVVRRRRTTRSATWSVETPPAGGGNGGLALRGAASTSGCCRARATSTRSPRRRSRSFHEEFAELRQRCPVAHSDAYNGFWALTRYDDVVAAVQ